MQLKTAPTSVHLFTLHVNPTTAPEFIDITNRLAELVESSHIQCGFALVFSKHTTAAIKIQENEPLLILDMINMLKRLAPQNAKYQHNDFSIRTVHMEEEECPNGHSHCQHLLLNSSETIPILDGNLLLGKYQSVFMVELDDQKKHREVSVQIIGV